MKMSETILASLLVSAVAGATTAVLVQSMRGDDPRKERQVATVESTRPSHGGDGAGEAQADPDLRSELDGLRMENAVLSERLRELEQRVAENAQRQPVEQTSVGELASSTGTREELASVQGDAMAVTPAFVESVGVALERIRAREAEEAEARRKEAQSARVEQRLLDLQEKLGLSRGQVADVRTALLTQEEKREALFLSMRDAPESDRRTVYEGVRSIRDETHAQLERTLTPEQYQLYRESEESEFRRFGGGGGPPGGGPPGFGGREGR